MRCRRWRWRRSEGSAEPVDEESITYFKTISEDVGIAYQSIIDMYLRDCAASHRKLDLDWKQAPLARGSIGG